MTRSIIMGQAGRLDRPFCLRRFKKLCLCTASLVLSTRLIVHKQSSLNLLRQNGHRVTKIYSQISILKKPDRYIYFSLINGLMTVSF